MIYIVQVFVLYSPTLLSIMWSGQLSPNLASSLECTSIVSTEVSDTTRHR